MAWDREVAPRAVLPVVAVGGATGRGVDRTRGVTAGELDPTPELREAVAQERNRLEGLVAGLQSDRDRLRDELADIEHQLSTATDRHRQLGHVLGEDDEGQPPLWRPEVPVRGLRPSDGENSPTDEPLRGAAIRQAAVEAALTHNEEPARSCHYRDWLRLIEAGGRRVDGQDPAATLLTQLSRCPLIVRAPDPGTYRLDAGALGRLRAKRDALAAEAAAEVAEAAEHGYDAIDLSQALGRIEAEVRRTDRAITEATAVIDALEADWFFGAADGDPSSSQVGADATAARVAVG